MTIPELNPELERRRLVVYVDGSLVTCTQPGIHSLGWGVVALHNDQHEEDAGCFVRPKSKFAGFHEQIAFVAAVRHAQRRGFSSQQMSVLCDDELFGYAQSWLHPENYQQRLADAVHERLRAVVDEFFEPPLYEFTLDVMRSARVVKLKGHSKHLNQERVDYLAKHAARAGLGLEMGPPMSFEDWAARGLKGYEMVAGEPVLKHWFAPFIESMHQEDACLPSLTTQGFNL